MERNPVGVIIAALMLACGFAFALPVGANVTAGTPVSLGAISAETAEAWGGNITEVNLSINSTTLHWQGFYGSVFGSLRLASGSNTSTIYTMKEWSVSNISGQIYASQSGTVNFAALNATAVTLGDVDTSFAFLSGANDRAAMTGNDNNNPQFSIGQYTAYANQFPMINSTNSSGEAVWQEIVMNDGDVANLSRFVFVGLLNTSGVAYNGVDANYQILVPQDAAGGLATPATYYFYGEVQ